MNQKFFLLTFLFFFNTLLAQESKDYIFYIDSIGNLSDETNYKYKRVVEDFYTKKDLYNITEYYKNGILKSKGISLNKFFTNYIGKYNSYYESGNKYNLLILSETGKSTKEIIWYENGEKKLERENTYDSINNKYNNRVIQFWNKDGVQKIIAGNGEYEEDNEYYSKKGTYLNGFKNGIWIGTDKKTNFSYTENYLNGDFISGKSIDSNRIEHSYTVLNKSLEPKKGLIDFFNYLHKITNEKKYFKDENQIIINIIFNKEGKYTNIKILPEISKKTEEKLILIINNYEGWNPQVNRGIPVYSEMKLLLAYNELLINQH